MYSSAKYTLISNVVQQSEARSLTRRFQGLFDKFEEFSHLIPLNF